MVLLVNMRLEQQCGFGPVHPPLDSQEGVFLRGGSSARRVRPVPLRCRAAVAPARMALFAHARTASTGSSMVLLTSQEAGASGVQGGHATLP
jgi:hypothetical protein